MKEVVWSSSLLFLYPFFLTFHLSRCRVSIPQTSKPPQQQEINLELAQSVFCPRNTEQTQAQPPRPQKHVCFSCPCCLVPPHTCLTLTSGISSVFKKHTVCTHFSSFGFLWKSAFRASFLFAFLFISLLKVVNRCPALEATVGKQRLLGGLERDQVSREVSFSDVNIVSPKATPRSAGATQGRARLGWVSRKLPGFAQGNTLGI